jgi:hypothetical protein
MAVFNSDGTRYKTINNTGSFRTLADGAIFYNGNGMWGTLITTKQGYSLGQSAQFNITQENPTNAQLQAYTPDSTTPLAAGQTAAPSSPPPPPTPVYGPGGITTQQQTRRTTNLLQNPNGHNVAVEITGDDNVVSIQQVGGAGHYLSVDLTGNVNNVNVLQTTTDLTTRHYMEAKVTGDNNSLLLQQRQTSKTQFVEINGSSNSITTDQRGNGNHYLDLKVTGNNHSAGIVQDGSGSHKAAVDLNGNQPWNFTLNQSGSTGKTYTLPHTMSDGSGVNGTCNAVGGCNLIINQQ